MLVRLRRVHAIRPLLAVMAFAVILAVAPASLASAQVTTTVLGTVKDQQGGVLPGATVVLISETKGTKSEPVVTNPSGDFVLPSVPPDTYTLQVEMPSFKTLKRTGLTIGGDPRIALGTLTLEVGGQAEVVNVTGEAPLIQSASGERSFTVDSTAVDNLPIANRNFTSLATLAPGVDITGAAGVSRVGGGGDSNIVMDGVSTSSPGNNAIMIRLNTESVGSVKVVTSGYQAEYGRASGVQVTSVTKGGTNRFHGSVYDVERSSDWNSNSQTNILNGDPKSVAKERDFGFSVGGRWAGRAARTNCSSSSATKWSRARPVMTSCATGCRRRWSAPAISRSPPTTSATHIHISRTRR